MKLNSTRVLFKENEIHLFRCGFLLHLLFFVLFKNSHRPGFNQSITDINLKQYDSFKEVQKDSLK